MDRKMAMVVLLVWNISFRPKSGMVTPSAPSIRRRFQVRVLRESYMTPVPLP